MRQLFCAVAGLCATTLSAAAGLAQTPRPVAFWLTNSQRTQTVSRQSPDLSLQPGVAASPLVRVDDKEVDQTIDGFGFAMTGGSAQLIHHMSPAKQQALLQEIFGHGPKDMGVSYLRVSIGSSDMDDHVFTFDDLPAGQTDPQLAHFTLAEDETDLIPVLRQVLAINPSIQILASPWTPPSWMKTNGAPKAGSLRPEDFAVYARYFVRYLQGMRERRIPITAVTIQNEPLNPKNTPSLLMEATEEEAFLRDALGPALKSAGLTTKVILYDHNCDRPDYPLTILNDPKARTFADGSGFHLYAGPITAMSAVHNAYPDKSLYFTEQMVVEHTKNGVLEPVARPVATVVIGAMRNWSRTVLLWNLAADPSFGPHTGDGGCPVCQGAITIDGDTVTRNIALYAIEHVSKFVPPGSVRIGSSSSEPDLSNVAWRTPSGSHVLLLTNNSDTPKSISVAVGGGSFTTSLDAGSVGTFTW